MPGRSWNITDPAAIVREQTAASGDIASKDLPVREVGGTGAVGIGAGSGFLASLPILGPAFASACASCVGLGGAAASGIALGWGTPVAIVVAMFVMIYSVRRTLLAKRAACSTKDYRRARVVVPLFTVSLAVAGYLLGAFVLAPLFQGGQSKWVVALVGSASMNEHISHDARGE